MSDGITDVYTSQQEDEEIAIRTGVNDGVFIFPDPEKTDAYIKDLKNQLAEKDAAIEELIEALNRTDEKLGFLITYLPEYARHYTQGFRMGVRTVAEKHTPRKDGE